MCMCIAWKGHPQNDLYCVRWDVKFYLLTHLTHVVFHAMEKCDVPLISLNSQLSYG